MFVIYALVDPRDNRPFYVGITDDVYTRFLQHLRCDGSNFRKDERIRELKAANIMMGMSTLQTVNAIQEARIREAYWIYHYIQLGITLLNNNIPTPLQYSSIEKQAQFTKMRRSTEADMVIAFHENREDMVLALRSKGFGKVAIIEKVWKVKAGGTAAYKNACTEYDQMVAQIVGEA
jgi:predicted GIY-YIG superfamily endonuclease